MKSNGITDKYNIGSDSDQNETGEKTEDNAGLGSMRTVLRYCVGEDRDRALQPAEIDESYNRADEESRCSRPTCFEA